jgi:hypothetical protein
LVHFDDIINRIKELKSLRHDSEVADLFKLSPNDFSNRKKRGTLAPLVLEWGTHENVCWDWLIAGRGSPNIDESDESMGECRNPVDMELLGRIIDRLEHWLEKGRKQLPSKKKARLISLLYEKFAETGKDVDDNTVVSYLKLVA